MKDRQRRFADEYLIDLNAEAAAVRAGYSPRYARGNAYKLVARSGITASLRRYRRQLLTKRQIKEKRYEI